MRNLPPIIRSFRFITVVLFGMAVSSAWAIPTIFVLGDSTAHNTARGKNGQPCVGWGTSLAGYFAQEKAVVANVAHAGQSSRTYFNLRGDWPRVRELIKPGDFVLLVFGINDGTPPQSPRSRGSLPGLGPETLDVKRDDGTTESVHTYGWYMTQMAAGVRARGASVILLTVTVRNIWSNPKVKFHDATPVSAPPPDYDSRRDRIERGTAGGAYTRWTKELGGTLGLPVIDLTNLCADRYEQMGREVVDAFYSDHNHTYASGADFIAETIVSGLKALPQSPFAPLLSAKGQTVAPAELKYIEVPASTETVKNRAGETPGGR